MSGTCPVYEAVRAYSVDGTSSLSDKNLPYGIPFTAACRENKDRLLQLKLHKTPQIFLFEQKHVEYELYKKSSTFIV